MSSAAREADGQVTDDASASAFGKVKALQTTYTCVQLQQFDASRYGFFGEALDEQGNGLEGSLEVSSVKRPVCTSHFCSRCCFIANARVCLSRPAACWLLAWPFLLSWDDGMDTVVRIES